MKNYNTQLLTSSELLEINGGGDFLEAGIEVGEKVGGFFWRYGPQAFISIGIALL